LFGEADRSDFHERPQMADFGQVQAFPRRAGAAGF
jgi:hypothetical protein